MWSQEGLRKCHLNKASGGDGIPVELFQILKDDAGKVPHSICQQIWKTQQWPQDWKRSVFIPIPREAMPKNAQTTVQLHSSQNTSKVKLKILQARLQQHVTLTTYVHNPLTKIYLRTQYPNWNRLFIFLSEAIGFNPTWLTALFIWIITIKWAIMF